MEIYYNAKQRDNCCYETTNKCESKNQYIVPILGVAIISLILIEILDEDCRERLSATLESIGDLLQLSTTCGCCISKCGCRNN